MPLALRGIDDVRGAPERLAERHVIEVQADQFKNADVETITEVKP
ncbi:hypothetical protein M2161_008747 [Streptomyces sp. SAI-133]|jgi:hypothetical protein|nr:hypothetical protein [Streptomyces sp. SAI-133]MDH6589641.1 hypothetical protein [Streptomyces sp. SAI-133]